MEFFEDSNLEPPTDFVDEFEDTYAPLEEEVDYDYEEFYNSQMMAPFTLEEILHHCIEPTLSDGFRHVGKIVIWCIIFRILTQSSSRTPNWMVHALSTTIGIIVSAHFFYTNVIYQILLTFLAWIMLHISNKIGHGCRGLLSAILCVSFNSICELFITNPVDWHQIRGAQIILIMKLISVAFDMDTDVSNQSSKPEKPKEPEEQPEEQLGKKAARKRKFFKKTEELQQQKKEPDDSDGPKEILILHVPTFWEYFGYALCPGTTVFGPWVPYKDYLGIYILPRWNFTWMTKIMFSMIFGFLFLTISTCFIQWFIPENQPIWISAYRDAMSFRASHYFVSFISEASAVACGFGCQRSLAPHLGVTKWDVPVAEPHNIEVPRSLVEVVISWNKPMHQWLKQYCFKKVIRFGKWTAVMTTFLASTFLHGFNFQLGAVLLSLGFFTYVEDRLRNKLATKFDASIRARRRPEDNFRHGEASFRVMLFNMLFVMLSMIHLMYLGVMFDQSDVQAEGYRWTHTIAKWNSLSFFSHWFMLLSLMLSFLF